jgi:hypothetical protein
VTSAIEGGRLSALRTGRLYPQEYPGTRFKRLKKSPVTPPEIDPGTFRIVAQYLNHRQYLVALKNNVFETFLIFHQQPKTDRQKVGETRDPSRRNNRLVTMSCGHVIH